MVTDICPASAMTLGNRDDPGPTMATPPASAPTPSLPVDMFWGGADVESLLMEVCKYSIEFTLHGREH